MHELCTSHYILFPHFTPNVVMHLEILASIVSLATLIKDCQLVGYETPGELLVETKYTGKRT